MSKRGLATFCLAGLLSLLLTSCGPAPSVSMVASTDHVALGGFVTLTGAFTPGRAGLAVRLQAGSGTSFQDTGAATTTDGSGSYSIPYTPTSAGVVGLRVAVVDSDQTTTSSPSSIRVLAPSAVRIAHIPAEVARAAKVLVTGTLTPGSAGRPVSLESTTDGSVWTAIATGTTDSAGNFSITAPTGRAGALQLRVVAAETTSASAGAGKVFSLFVADYKAAGKVYLGCVKDVNTQLDRLEAVGQQFDAGTSSLQALRQASAKLAALERVQITCLKGYVWPPSVAKWVADRVGQMAVLADAESRVGKAANIASMNAIWNGRDYSDAGTAASADAAKIRRQLGLPARSS